MSARKANSSNGEKIQTLTWIDEAGDFDVDQWTALDLNRSQFQHYFLSTAEASIKLWWEEITNEAPPCYRCGHPTRHNEHGCIDYLKQRVKALEEQVAALTTPPAGEAPPRGRRFVFNKNNEPSND